MEKGGLDQLGMTVFYIMFFYLENDQLERIQKTLEKQVKELKGAEGALRTKVTAEGAQFDLKYNKLKTDGRLTNIFENTGTDKLDTHHYNLWYEHYFFLFLI
jgi:hypothetical protein